MQAAGQSPTPQVSAQEASIFILMLTVDSLHFIFARAFVPYLAPTVAALWVLGIATIQIGVYGLWSGKLSLRIAITHRWFFLAIGFLVAASTALNYAAVAIVDAGTAAMLGRLGTVFTLLLGLFWLHERLRPIQIGGALVSVIGLLIITFQPGDFVRFGTLMIVVATLMYALHAALVKRNGQTIEFLNFFFYRLLFTSFFLLLISAGAGSLVWPTRTVLLLLFVAATVDVTISRIFYSLALRRLPVSVHAILLTASPVLSVLWALIFFDTLPSKQQLLGGVTVLLGVFLAAQRRSTGRKAN